MPKVKKGKRYKKTYNEDLMQKALDEIRENGSIRTISSKYGIPRSTLQYRLSTNFKKAACGPSPVLTIEEEKSLKQWIVTCEKAGFPIDKDVVRTTVKRMLDKNNKQTIFKDNCPGNGWYRAFLRRHNDLFQMSLDGHNRNLRNSSWSTEVYQYLKESHCEDILKDPERVFKTDESNFQLCPKTGRISFYEADINIPKSAISVMHMFSASGRTAPPVLVFPCKKMLMEMRTALPSKWGAGLSGLGYISSNVYCDYVSCILHPNLTRDKVKFPIILFLDGHSAHLSFELYQLCTKLKIIPVAAYLNPAYNKISKWQEETFYFRPLQTGWEKFLCQRKKRLVSDLITKNQFLPVLQRVVENISSDIIKNGLRKANLFPWPISEKVETDLPTRTILSERDNRNGEKTLPVLEFNQFKKIVGPKTMRMLQNRNHKRTSDEFCILTEMYDYFMETNSLSLQRKDFQNCETLLGLTSDDVHEEISGEHISIPQFIKAEPLDLDFDDLDGEFYQDVADSVMENNLEMTIKTEFPD